MNHINVTGFEKTDHIVTIDINIKFFEKYRFEVVKLPWFSHARL